MHHAIIEARDVCVSYRESLALEHVSFSVHEQSFVVVAGPNGAGKTTLLTCINGLGRLRRGSVCVYGTRVSPATATAVRRQIAYLPQFSRVDSRIPVRVLDVVRMGRFGRIGMCRRFSRADEEAVDEAVSVTGISKLLQRPFGNLSGGEQRKVALARCLAQQPRILLLDEPLTNLDIPAQAGLLDLIEGIYRRTRLTTVMVVHTFDLLPSCLNRVILLKSGSIMLDAPPEQAFQPQALSQLYGCTVRVDRCAQGLIVRVQGAGQ